MKVLFILTIGLFSVIACAAQNSGSGYGRHHQGMRGHMGKNMPMMSAEMHKDMAKMHSEMATCLESKKSKDECQKIAFKYRAKMCTESGKNKNCPYAEMMEESTAPEPEASK